MKKRFTATCALLLAAVMTFTGCSSKTSDNTGNKDTAQSGTESDAKDNSGASDNGDAQEISVMIWDRQNAAPNTTNEDNPLVTWIKDEVLKSCNVKVNFVSVPRSGTDDKLNIMMAGGTAPDIVFTYDQSIYVNYAANGGLADLTSAYKNYGSTISSEIGNIQSMGQLNGKQYAIMKRRGQQIPRHIAYIRKDWLDALGMSMPKTKDELFKCLEAFKEKNPGNVKNVIPWGMGGSPDTEKFYLNFIASYIPELSERDAYIYSEYFKIFAPGGIDGLKKMNELHSKGLITKDFATDTTNDIYKQDMCAGNVGFSLCDSTEAFYNFDPTLAKNIPGAQFVPVNCFDTPEGTYINPTEPLYGMFVMVPATSSDKADACVKYLNWLADPANAENVQYFPGHKVNDKGVPEWLSEEETKAKGYPGNASDYSIVNEHYKYVDNKDAIVSSWLEGCDWADEYLCNQLYDVMNTGQYLFPTFPANLKSEATYLANAQKLAIDYVYKLINCDPAKFDSLQKTEYDKLVAAGLEKIFEERASYYDTNVAKK